MADTAAAGSATVVVKIGSSSVTDADSRLLSSAIAKLCDEVAGLRQLGHHVVVVSSGAVASGVGVLGFTSRPKDLPTLQALSAVGQSHLMTAYNNELGRHGLIGGQILLTPLDFADRRQYSHARQTLRLLLELGVVPIINENDALANEEIRYSDNDRLAALVANLIGAERLVLLTDTDGLYDSDPRHNSDAALLQRVEDVDDTILSLAGGTGSDRGSGGMANKIQAGRIASLCGVRTVIAKATRPNVVIDAVNEVPGVGTIIEARQSSMGQRKLWIGFAARVLGDVTIDDGAVDALISRGKSLLTAGVKEVQGDFSSRDCIEIKSIGGKVVARALAYQDAAELRPLVGVSSSQMSSDSLAIVAHRDDMVLLT